MFSGHDKIIKISATPLKTSVSISESKTERKAELFNYDNPGNYEITNEIPSGKSIKVNASGVTLNIKGKINEGVIFCLNAGGKIIFNTALPKTTIDVNADGEIVFDTAPTGKVIINQNSKHAKIQGKGLISGLVEIREQAAEGNIKINSEINLFKFDGPVDPEMLKVFGLFRMPIKLDVSVCDKTTSLVVNPSATDKPQPSSPH